MKSINEEYRVSDEQLDAAQRFVNCATKQVIYVVKSASDPDTQYIVKWDRNHSRFGCECKASQVGMCCWHVRSSLANEMLYQQAKRDEEAAAIRIAEEKAEMERLMMVPPTRPSEKAVKAAIKRNRPQGFSLLR